MWQDDAASLAPKYAWAVREWDNFGVWATGMVRPPAGPASGSAPLCAALLRSFMRGG
jgi:hypothetical protein